MQMNLHFAIPGRVGLASILVILLLAAAAPRMAWADDPASPTLVTLVEKFDRNFGTAKVIGPVLGEKTLEVQDAGVKERLITLERGDRLSITVSGAPDKLVLDAVKAVQRPASASIRAIAIFLSALVILGFAAVATRFDILILLVGVDNRYSKSQIQLVIWFGIAMLAYLATAGLRVWAFGLDYVGGVGITANLLALSGLSAFSFGGAKAIAVSKAGDPAVPAANAKTTAAAPHLPDIFSDDSGRPDLGDIQMMFITLIAAAVYLLKTWQFLAWLSMEPTVDLPDVDTALLSAFGLGQGAYLAKKAVSGPGKG